MAKAPTINDGRGYKYEMGFSADGQPLPDPSVFSGKRSALDSSGSRDANGLLHRNMVAIKNPIKLEYHSISYAMMEYILAALEPASHPEYFSFIFPNPSKGDSEKQVMSEIKAYVGDRDWEVQQAKAAASDANKDWKLKYFGDLKFSVIEY